MISCSAIKFWINGTHPNADPAIPSGTCRNQAKNFWRSIERLWRSRAVLSTTDSTAMTKEPCNEHRRSQETPIVVELSKKHIQGFAVRYCSAGGTANRPTKLAQGVQSTTCARRLDGSIPSPSWTCQRKEVKWTTYPSLSQTSKHAPHPSKAPSIVPSRALRECKTQCSSVMPT